MKNIVIVRNVKIGEGIPKICVPLVGRNNEELLKEISRLKAVRFDIIEWRMDYHVSVEAIDKMQETLLLIRRALGNVPLLATFRSKEEGGEKSVSRAYYSDLNRAIISTRAADLIDIELSTGDEIVRELVSRAHDQGVKVVMSHHDFEKTPSKEEVIQYLCRMQVMDADLPKIAVMPQSQQDVLTLLSATHEMATQYADRPIITMSMSGMGMISRLAGETFGSALTFGCVKAASAPGQIAANRLADILQLMHENK